MPWSSSEGKRDAFRVIEMLAPRRVLDVGAGAGIYGQGIAERMPDTSVEAVEVWVPYVKRFNLHGWYDAVHIQDIRRFRWAAHERYDLVIFGDVLEHMSKADAVDVWDTARGYADWLLASVPHEGIHLHQGEEEGNPYEAHLSHFVGRQFERGFEGIVSSFRHPNVGVYLAEGYSTAAEREREEGSG